MCCIFTCCGWMIDLIQRLWTFTMSCCISSAVCCSFIIACMAGIALGYNYSLAEYIDLKETNVSVYLKRGIFDDDIADDMGYRRRNPGYGQLRSNDMIPNDQEEEPSPPPQSGRRKLDDSIYESERQQNFEGSLMKLTAKPPFDPHITSPPTINPQLDEQISAFSQGSLNQLKAIQALVNARKMISYDRANARKNMGQNINNQDIEQNVPPLVMKEDRLPYYPGQKDPDNPGRRIMLDEMMSSTINSLRLAIPDQQFNNPEVWSAPKKYQEEKVPDSFDRMNSPTYPPPITLRTAPLPPVRTKATTVLNEPFIYSKDLIDEKRYQPFHKDLLLSDINDTPFHARDNQEFVKNMKFDSRMSKEDDDYEENFKGLPHRKKRNNQIIIINTTKNTTKSNNTYSYDPKIGPTEKISVKVAFTNYLYNTTENKTLVV